MKHKKKFTQAAPLGVHQSAPRPTVQEAAQMAAAQEMHMPVPEQAMDGFRALAQVIGREQIQEARLTLQRYKEGKANLEQKVIEAEQWYKLRHWECMRRERRDETQVEPVSGWLFNAIANKHADAMDNYPSPNFLPREAGDKAEAEMLSSVVPVVLEQNHFEDTYDEESDDKLKGGTGVYGVFWDESKLGGLGDITVEAEDVLSLFWEPGITDIQRSRHFFHVALVDNDWLVGEYPQLQGRLGSSAMDLSKFIYDDKVDTSQKSAVIDWYYKKRQGGRTVLHYCKFVNDTVLFATENEPETYPNGWYDHGLYPYVFDPLFRMKGTPCGFGYVDVAKSVQEYIDRGNQAIMKNMLANASPRYFVRTDGSVNEEEYANQAKAFVHTDSNLGQDSIMPIEGKPLNDIYVSVLVNKVEELKEVTGNRDISTGGTSSGVTAASAIAAMQEAGSKLSRANNKATYRAFRKVCMMIVELIRQFYDMPRCFRIMGQNGAERFVEYSNAGLRPQAQGMELGVDLGYRVPQFDIEITAQKQSPYSKLGQNELALQFFGAGFFNPQLADQALACLDMMDFDRKHFVMQKIAANGGMYQQMMLMQQQMMQMAQALDRLQGSNLAGQMGVPAPAGAPAPSGRDTGDVGQVEALGGETGSAEAPVVREARRKIADSTAPG